MSISTKLKLIQCGYVVLSFFLALMILSSTVFADAADFGSNTYNWLKQQIFWIALLVIAGIAVPFIAKKMWMQLVGFLVLAALILVIVDDPSKLKAIGTTIWAKVFGA